MPLGMTPITNFFADLFGMDEPARGPARPIRRGGTQSTKPKKADSKPRTTSGPQKVPVQTKRQALQETAKRETGRSGGRFRAYGSGINQWLPFEVVNRAVAAGADIIGYGPNDKVGWDYNNYLQNLEAIRRGQAADYEAHPGYYAAGGVSGAIGGGGGLSLGVRGAGAAASKLPGAAGKIGKAVQASQILRAGEKGRNLAKLAASGAALGGAEEAVRGGDAGDIASSATVGALAAPVAGKLVDLGGFLFRPAADLLRRQSAAGRLLRRFTSATADEMQAARSAYKTANNGAEPTLFEILPANDVPRIRKLLSRMSPNIQQEAAEAIQARARNVRPEMNANIDRATRAARGQVARGFADDLAASRGGPLQADVPMASEATTSRVGVERLRSAEAGNIMAPYDSRVVARSVDELLPSSGLRNDGSFVLSDADPEAAKAIRDAAGNLRLAGRITIDDISKIIRGDRNTGARGLDAVVRRGGTGANAAQRAINHLEDFLQANHPDAAEAMARMKLQYAGKSRVGEGIDEGMASRPSAEAAQKLDQYAYGKAYETPEGAQGRMIGQTHALRQSVSGTPEDAMRAVGALAEDTNLQRAVSENISPRASARLTEGAKAQFEGLRRLASLDKNLKDSIPDSDISVLGNALLTFNPASFPLTRLSAFMRVIRQLRLPEKADRLLVENLFSQDSRRISAALSRLNNAGRDGRRSIVELAGALAVADVAGPYAADPQSYEQGRVSTNSESDAPVDQPWLNDPEVPADQPWLNDPEVDYGADTSFGESAVLSVFPDAQITDALRDPNSALGRANEDSYHVRTNGAVDVQPIPGMTFEQFVQSLKDAGYNVVEAIDEVKHPSKHATGPHWHVVFG